MRVMTALCFACVAAATTHGQMNIRVRGNGVDIGNAGGSGLKLIYPVATRTEWESDFHIPGKYHLFDKRPAAIADKDYACTPLSASDSRKDYRLESFSSDKQGSVLIAVAGKVPDSAGWTSAGASFTSSMTTFNLYNYAYAIPGVWVNIPNPAPAVPPLVFAEKGRLRFDNPLPISALGEGVELYGTTDPYNTGDYTFDPHLIILPNGDYVAGRLSNRYLSKDKGLTWSHLNGNSFRLRHSSTFYHEGAMYILGDMSVGDPFGGIAKSTDGGKTWSAPVRLKFHFRNSPSHVAVGQGRIWCAYELADKTSTVMSASATSDLMNPDSWVRAIRADNISAGDEPDMLIGRDGWPVILPKGDYKVRAVSPTKTIVEKGVDDIKLPGNGSKYSGIYDPVSDKYWFLTSHSSIPGNIRTGIALFSSPDLKTFKFERQAFQGTSIGFHGFNYPFMQIDGSDIVFTLRTSYENDRGQAQRWHDANKFTFHRVRNFRTGISILGTPVAGAWNPVLRVSASRVEYEVPRAGRVELGIFGLDGSRLQAFSGSHSVPGRYSLPLDGRRYPPGMYVFRMAGGQGVVSQGIRIPAE